jgi:hypothetical protein
MANAALVIEAIGVLAVGVGAGVLLLMIGRAIERFTKKMGE